MPDFEPDEPPVLPPWGLRLLSRVDPSRLVDVPDRLPVPSEPLPVSGEDAPGDTPPWPLLGVVERVMPGGHVSEVVPDEPLLPLPLPAFWPVLD